MGTGNQPRVTRRGLPIGTSRRLRPSWSTLGLAGGGAAGDGEGVGEAAASRRRPLRRKPTRRIAVDRKTGSERAAGSEPAYNFCRMRLNRSGVWTTVWLVALTAGLCAQSAAPAVRPSQAASQVPTFRLQIDLVRSDIVVRDDRGNFVSDLTKDEFEIFEDGVKQAVVSMTMSHGGRVTNLLAPPPAPPPEGIILPPTRRTNDVSGRIFVFLVDDLHLQFHNTVRVREIFKKISKTLIHDGDQFAIVSTGTSSIAVGLTYDRKRLDESIENIIRRH